MPTIPKLTKETIAQRPKSPSIPSVKFVALVTPTNKKTIKIPYRNLISTTVPKKLIVFEL